MKNKKITWKFPSIGAEVWWRDWMSFTSLMGGITLYPVMLVSLISQLLGVPPHEMQGLGWAAIFMLMFAALLALFYGIGLKFRFKHPKRFKTMTRIGIGCYAGLILLTISTGTVLFPVTIIGFLAGILGIVMIPFIFITAILGSLSPLVLPLLGIRSQVQDMNHES